MKHVKHIISGSKGTGTNASICKHGIDQEWGAKVRMQAPIPHVHKKCLAVNESIERIVPSHIQGDQVRH